MASLAAREREPKPIPRGAPPPPPRGHSVPSPTAGSPPEDSIPRQQADPRHRAAAAERGGRTGSARRTER
eukprot:scaffold72668_cov54-Phaeocystis_antarctica.AAC.1